MNYKITQKNKCSKWKKKTESKINNNNNSIIKDYEEKDTKDDSQNQSSNNQSKEITDEKIIELIPRSSSYSMNILRYIFWWV